MKTQLCSISAILVAAVGAFAESQQGVIEPIKSLSINAPVVQEVITKVLVKEGDTVKTGDVLVELRRDREELDVRLTQKLIELKRFIARGNEKLYKEQMGSEEKALEAKTDLELAELQLEGKQIALREKTVKSPVDGIVVKKYKEAGESVSREEHLVDLIDIDQVRIRFYLPPNLRRTLKEQATVEVKVPDLDNGIFAGKITYIDPRNEALSGQVLVRVEVENRDHRISPGMKALADFAK
jgi:RND family efflux transporter MFP subunit